MTGGYHNVVLPQPYSQGSLFALSFDTRVVSLESGFEERLARFAPWGRRVYTITRGVADVSFLTELRNFFMLRGGALNAFKFRDPLDYASTESGTVHRPGDSVIADDDQELTFVSGRTYQCVQRISDGVRTVVRPITKIDETDPANTPRFAKNGLFDGAAVLDPETGLVTFSGVDVINEATGGYLFYVPVRFGDTTDKAFTIEAQSTPETDSMPPIELIEELGDTFISQDYQYGGSYDGGTISADFTIAETNGRLQRFTPSINLLVGTLPRISTIPLGGPIVVIENVSGVNTLDIRDENGDPVAPILPQETRQFWVGITPNGRVWATV